MKKFVFLVIVLVGLGAGVNAVVKNQELRSDLKSLTSKVFRHRDIVFNPVKNCDDNIESVEWRTTDTYGKEYVSAFIVPTTCGRLGLDPKKAWHEFLDKVPPHPLWDDVNSNDPVYKSMRNQFICHWVNPEAQLNRPAYRIEPHRPSDNLLETYLNQCNRED